MKYLHLLLIFFCIPLFADMQYFQGEVRESQAFSKQEITLVNWNVLGLPDDRCAVGPWKNRIDGMVKVILTENADLVIFQECFQPDLSQTLFERLKGTYQHVYLHLNEESTPLPSGLAVFSKYPIQDFHFTPHPNLLDGERNSKMGTCDFVLVNEQNLPIAHIAASHFQGSSRCEWRTGVTDDGLRQTYGEIRQAQSKSILELPAPNDLPRYVCGDLNVDRKSHEFYTSLLNPQINRTLVDGLTPETRMQASSTNFFKHMQGIGKMFPELSKNEACELTLLLKDLGETEIVYHLEKFPWTQSISDFNENFFDDLKSKINLPTAQHQMVWNYFVAKSIKIVESEKHLWASHQNSGKIKGPIGEEFQVSALPFDEALDYILGVNDPAYVINVEILKGFDKEHPDQVYSDHHPVKAKLRVKTY